MKVKTPASHPGLCLAVAAGLTLSLYLSRAGANEMLTAEELVQALALQPHVEGGYFRRTYQPDEDRAKVVTADGERYGMTSIFYLLTRESPIGHWHRNRSDIVHYFHLGGPITYYLIHPDGRLETVTMGPDPARGQRLQLTVKGGTWKASMLASGPYGLISEAVSPGFDYADMTLGERQALLRQFPQHHDLIIKLSHAAPAP